MPKSVARVLGPYKNGEKWRLVVIEGLARKSLVVDSLESAIAVRDEIASALKKQTAPRVGPLLEEYLQGLLLRGVLEETVEKITRMLRGFLPLDEPANAISAERAQELYVEETRRKKANGQPIAADTHHLLLRRTKHFYKWAVSRRHISENPFAEIKPIGRPRRGKPQLRIDEARKFVVTALSRARALDVGATAALMQIFLGLRPTEAVIRVVRDLDDQGRVLWVPFGKTQNARRRLQVPDVLKEILLRHAQGKPMDAPLLGPVGEAMHTRHALRHRLHQLCAEADVPQICPHSLRGLNATLAVEAGATAHHVAAALGHASFATTARHYADASTVANASLRRVADLLASDSPEDKKNHDLGQLVRLLREQLSEPELQILRQKLTASDEQH
jgi:integrase